MYLETGLVGHGFDSRLLHLIPGATGDRLDIHGTPDDLVTNSGIRYTHNSV